MQNLSDSLAVFVVGVTRVRLKWILKKVGYGYVGWIQPLPDRKEGGLHEYYDLPSGFIKAGHLLSYTISEV
jgi:hypothetical protein